MADEYVGPNQSELPAQRETPTLTLKPKEKKDPEELFMRDAIQRAHDAELEALASLALIRNNTDENSMMLMHMEMDPALSPNIVDRHLREDETRQPSK